MMSTYSICGVGISGCVMAAMYGLRYSHISGSLMGCCFAGIANKFINTYSSQKIVTDSLTLLLGSGSLIGSFYVQNNYMRHALHSIYGYSMLTCALKLINTSLKKLNKKLNMMPDESSEESNFKLLLCFVFLLLPRMFLYGRSPLREPSIINGFIAAICY